MLVIADGRQASSSRTQVRRQGIQRKLGASRTPQPHTLRAIDGEGEMIVGFDDDLAGEATRVANRLLGPLTRIHASPERVLGRGCSTRPC